MLFGYFTLSMCVIHCVLREVLKYIITQLGFEPMTFVILEPMSSNHIPARPPKLPGSYMFK